MKDANAAPVLWRPFRVAAILATAAAAAILCACKPDAPEAPSAGTAEGIEGIVEGPGTSGGQWQYLGGDSAHTRYSPASQIDASNFESLEEAWVWDGASFGAQSGRSTPSYINGRLYTVAGPRRYVIALDPANGELLWSYREPNTARWEYSMRQDYGKGVAYSQVDGRGVIYIISPAFFLTALDAETGEPLEGFGKPVPIEGFPQTGVVDLLADLGHEYDPNKGLPLEKGYITASSPPIVVNGVIVVGNSAEQGTTRRASKTCPATSSATTRAPGNSCGSSTSCPQPGEFGHDTWENDSWEWTGDISSWAPLSADPERGIVYIPTERRDQRLLRRPPPRRQPVQHEPHRARREDGRARLALPVVHHDIWNYDTPDGAGPAGRARSTARRIPAVVQATKQAFAYAFNRVTGEPLWPIEERPVPQSRHPGREDLRRRNRFRPGPRLTKCRALTHDDLIDFTPELRQAAIDNLEEYQIGPLFHPPLHRDNDLGFKAAFWCPGDSGGSNIDGPAAADPETGILYVTSKKGCTSRIIAPGAERDAILEAPTGTTISDYAVLRADGVRGPDDLPLFKPPYSRITAIDMNTGEHLWWVPVGETPSQVLDHPQLEGMHIPNTGTGSFAPMTLTKTLLLYASEASDGTPHLYAIDKQTGESIGKVEVSGQTRYGTMTYMHDGRQYVVLQTGPTLTAVALPE